MRFSTIFASLLLLLSTLFSSADAQIIVLKFTGTLNSAYTAIDSVKVSNLTQGSDTTLYFPDTTLFILNVGTDEAYSSSESFIFQSGGFDPSTGKFRINICLPDHGNLKILANDLLGRSSLLYNSDPGKGCHFFDFTPGEIGFCLLTAIWQSKSKTIKLIHPIANPDRQLGLALVESSNYLNGLKPNIENKSFFFSAGDQLKFTGYWMGNSAVLSATILSSQVYTFHFGMNFPCQGIPSFVYGGQTYQTVKIGTQCWMKENLNIGSMITSIQSSQSHSDCSSNLTIEKYCFDNDPANCLIYGGFYDWDEMMTYKPQHTGGICPFGWHIPTDDDWCILTTYLDTAVDCSLMGWSGTSIAGLMKEPGLLYWNATNPGISNQSGFGVQGAGYRTAYGYFGHYHIYGQFWSSTETSGTTAIYRSLGFTSPQLGRNSCLKTFGYSIRCIKDN
jgi:uncharacterized protein (TIGR02145 family)